MAVQANLENADVAVGPRHTRQCHQNMTNQQKLSHSGALPSKQRPAKAQARIALPRAWLDTRDSEIVPAQNSEGSNWDD